MQSPGAVGATLRRLDPAVLESAASSSLYESESPPFSFSWLEPVFCHMQGVSL